MKGVLTTMGLNCDPVEVGIQPVDWYSACRLVFSL